MNNDDEDQNQVLINIDDGFYFKNIFLSVNLLKDHINVELSPDSLFLEFVDETNRSYSKITIFTSKIKNYVYNFRDDNGDLKPYHSMGFKADEMITSAKSITKHDGVLITLEKGLHLLKIVPRKSSLKDGENIYDSFVNLLGAQELVFDDAEYSVDYSFKTPVKTFSEFCGVSINKKCLYIDVYGYKNGAIFVGKHSESKMATRFAGGVTPDLNDIPQVKIDVSTNSIKKTINIMDPDGVILYLKIPIKIIKAITKFNNFALKNSYIYFTIEQGKPLRISVDIHSFGNYTLLISDKETEAPSHKKKSKLR